MRHVNGFIFERSYRNQVVNADIVAAFLEAPSDQATMKLLGHMSLIRDPTAPFQPTQEQRAEVKGDLNVLEAKDRLETARKAIQKRSDTLKAAARKAQQDPLLKAELVLYNNLKKAHANLIQRKVTALFKHSRKEHFNTIGETILHNQHTGQTKPFSPKTPHFYFPEREQLVYALFTSKLPESYQEKVASSCEIIRFYESLCHRRKNWRPRHQLPAADTNTVEVVDAETLPNVDPSILNMEVDSYPLRCRGFQCLFCLGNEALDAKTRAKVFASAYTMTRHAEKQHLKYLKEPFTCPHPTCSTNGVQLEDHDIFKCHALQVHGIAHSS